MPRLSSGAPRPGPLAAVAVVAGLLLGGVDLAGQLLLPYPWANLANSPAVWAVAAFAIGAWVRVGRARAALAGVLLLLVAVEAYSLSAILVLGDDLADLYRPATLMWLVAGVLAGVVFGLAGMYWRGGRRWPSALGLAVLSAVFVAEGVVRLRVMGWTTSVILFALALLVPLVLGRSARQRLASLALAVPVAALGAVAYLVGLSASA